MQQCELSFPSLQLINSHIIGVTLFIDIAAVLNTLAFACGSAPSTSARYFNGQSPSTFFR
jgi:hypothetical protein